MKVLLSAYACEPWSGSEPGSGFLALMAAASQHEVWVLTRENNLPGLQRFFEHHPYRGQVHLVGVDRSERLRHLKKQTGILGMHVYYDLWQREAGRRGVELDQSVGFDLVHHATFANYWTRVGVAAVPKPLVWGPVGGAVNTPWPLLGQLGLRGIVNDSGRAVGRSIMRLLIRSPRPVIALAQNRETARRLDARLAVRVLPNALAVEVSPERSGPRSSTVVFAGRLIPLKGALLAVRAFHLVGEDATMILAGDGPERRRIEREIHRLGLEERVSLLGWVPRGELMRRLAFAGALLHPAFHEEAGWIVAESLNLGTPVVCLDRGGPPILADQWPDVMTTTVSPARPKAIAAALATAIDWILANLPEVPADRVRPKLEFEDALLLAYEDAVQGSAQ